jgi:hypothetical protein
MTKAAVEELLKLPPEERLEIAEFLWQSVEPQEEPRPAYLYKYLCFCEGLEDLFARGRIKFTTPSDFDDPLDCMIEPLWDTSGQQVLGQQVFLRVQRSLGVLSLTGEPLSVTMWAHYGDNHRGLCVRFATEGNDYFGRAQRVQYRQGYPAFSGLTKDSHGPTVRQHSADEVIGVAEPVGVEADHGQGRRESRFSATNAGCGDFRASHGRRAERASSRVAP